MPPTENAERSDIVSELFDEAYVINEEQEALNKRRNAVRASLRNLRDTGRLSDEDAKEIEELYPTRTRKSADAAEDADSGDDSGDGGTE